MSSIQQLKERRFLFLKLLYEKTGGNKFKHVNMQDIGQELGLTKDETDITTQYLVGEYLMEYTAMGGGIGITHEGVKEVEEALENPEEPTHYFPPVNIINIHHMENSQIAQGSTNLSQSFTLSANQLTELNNFLTELKANLDKLALNNEEMSEIQADIATLESQAGSSKPKPRVMTECLASIRKILEGASGAMIASQLLPYLPALLSMFD